MLISLGHIDTMVLVKQMKGESESIETVKVAERVKPSLVLHLKGPFLTQFLFPVSKTHSTEFFMSLKKIKKTITSNFVLFGL